EALMQLTLGAPQVVYYGGMFNTRLRYFDAQRRRPGLPQDVAALVQGLDPEHFVVELVNTSPSAEREVVVQAGGLAEHCFRRASYAVATSPYPGKVGAYAPETLTTRQETLEIDAAHFKVKLPPATHLRLELEVKRHTQAPSYRGPAL
ncbi:MAG: hypothetical protein IT369_21605, partial [Candidatus Latescibacteria bacterium]|nr:hypothetical protein [Candidatus Latescibacterota bacterium]